MRAIAGVIASAQDEDQAVAAARATLRANLGWEDDNETRAETLGCFAPVARAAFASLAPPEAKMPEAECRKCSPNSRRGTQPREDSRSGLCSSSMSWSCRWSNADDNRPATQPPSRRSRNRSGGPIWPPLSMISIPSQACVVRVRAAERDAGREVADERQAPHIERAQNPARRIAARDTEAAQPDRRHELRDEFAGRLARARAPGSDSVGRAIVERRRMRDHTAAGRSACPQTCCTAIVDVIRHRRAPAAPDRFRYAREIARRLDLLARDRRQAPAITKTGPSAALTRRAVGGRCHVSGLVPVRAQRLRDAARADGNETPLLRLAARSRARSAQDRRAVSRRTAAHRPPRQPARRHDRARPAARHKRDRHADLIFPSPCCSRCSRRSDSVIGVTG